MRLLAALRHGLAVAALLVAGRAFAQAGVGIDVGRPGADPAADGARHRSHADAVRSGATGARSEARRLGAANRQPARRAAGAVDAARADRGVFDPRRRGVEDRPQGPGQRRAVRRREERSQDAHRSRLRARRRADRRHVAAHHRRECRAAVPPEPVRAGINAGVDRIIEVVGTGQPLPAQRAAPARRSSAASISRRCSSCCSSSSRSSAASCAHFRPHAGLDGRRGRRRRGRVDRRGIDR